MTTMAVTAGLLLGIAPAAHAVSPIATISGLTPYQMSASTFTVSPTDPSTVCSVAYGEKVRKTAPYTFVYNPAGAYQSWVNVNNCDGTSTEVDLGSSVPFRVENVVQPAGVKDPFVIVSTNVDNPTTVTLSDADGKVVSQASVDGYGQANIPLPGRDRNGTTKFALSMDAGNGVSFTTPVALADGWAMMSGDRATFAPCSTVTWALDSSQQPKNASTFKKDLKASLARLSKETGLTFVESDDFKSANIRYQFGRIQSSGLGGPEGDVTFSSTDDWVSNRYAGFGPARDRRYGGRTWSGGPDGRGWLIIHETMHVLGFDHVSDKTAVMAPMDSGRGKFTKGDLDGLHTMYPTAGCVPTA